MPTHIYIAQPGDEASVAAIAATTFREKWLEFEKAEDVAAYVDTYFTPDYIAVELKQQDIVYLLYKIDGRAVGYCKLILGAQPEESTLPHPAEISKLYVLAAYRYLGAGQQLMHEAEQLAAANGCETLWLGVWKQNEGALRFYERLGYTMFGVHLFVMGDSASEDWLMKKSVMKP